MKSNTPLLLDVAEGAISLIPEGSTAARLSAREIRDLLVRRNPFRYGDLNSTYVSAALRALFPAYKNRRRRVQRFKVREADAYATALRLGMRLRPPRDIGKTGKP